LERVGAGKDAREGVSGFEGCAVFGIETVSEWPPTPGTEAIVASSREVALQDVREAGCVKRPVLISVPESLEDPQRMVAVSSFVRLRPVNDCLRLWPETLEL